VYLRAYTSVVKPGQRHSDETSYLSFDGVNLKILGTAKPSNPDVLKALGEVAGSAGEAGEETKKVKATFKIEINDEEKKVRDGQQTTVYHTGSRQGGPLIEVDEEDRREMERERMADIDEQEHEDDDDEGGEDVEDDPDEDLDF
jgi:hypothetical protein